MTSIQKKVVKQTFLLGIIVTFLVVIADSVRLTQPLEYFLYDQRARAFQFFTPPPTDTIVHANIDDETLQLVGRWPWNRDALAEILDEFRDAGAKAVTMDILFLEPQAPEYRPGQAAQTRPAQASAPTTMPADAFTRVDRDAILARSIASLPRSVIGLLTDRAPQLTRESRAFYGVLSADLEVTPGELFRRLGRSGAPGEEDLSRFIGVRKLAMRDRLFKLVAARPDITREELGKTLLPHVWNSANQAVSRLLVEQEAHVRAINALFRYAPRAPQPTPHEFLKTDLDFPPTDLFAASASAAGTVSNFSDADGFTRSVPLWTEYRGRLFPQMGLAAAIAMLDVNPAEVRFKPDGFILPTRDGERFVPTRAEAGHGGRAGYFLDIPWFGPVDHWQCMYDPKKTTPLQQISVTEVWVLLGLKKRIVQNNRNGDDAVEFLLAFLAPDPNAQVEFAALRARLAPDDSASRAAAFRQALDLARDAGYLKPIAEFARSDEGEQRLAAAAHALKTIVDNMDEFRGEAIRRKNQLETAVRGKNVLLGWTATAIIADFVPTSLHAKAPGMTIHGTVYNAIMTNHYWRRLPDWTSSLAVAAVGLLATACVAFLAAVPAFAASAALAAGYVLFNGLLVFDFGGRLLGVAGPLAAIAAVWSIGTVFRFFIESRERRRITESFQTRVDPALVAYVIENPDKVQLTGEKRELSVVFTDLAGFTTLSEKLGEDTVSMLNKYMGIMVPAIRRHGGYVNKFLGDGIMFFFGRPRDVENHARQAVVTVLEMQKLLVDFNKELVEQNLPTLKMRAGICTGEMIVGDAGSTDALHRAADYTVLGDNVNLGARLESANKATGTLMLMTERTVELMGDTILARPVGRLVVVGKTQGVMVYEPLCLRSEATPGQLQLVELTAAVVHAFQAAGFQKCLDACDAMETAVGESKITKLYRSLSKEHLAHPPATPFDGCITLSEK